MRRMDTDAETIRVKFGKNVRRLRKAQGLSQEAFAYACGLDRTYVGGIERGERNIGIENIGKVARGLGVPPSSLFEFSPHE